MFCNNCGAFIEDGAAFCPRCGMRLGDSSDQTVVRPAVPQTQQLYQQAEYQQPGGVTYTAVNQGPARTSGFPLGAIFSIAGAVAVIASMFLAWVDIPIINLYAEQLSYAMSEMGGLGGLAIPSAVSVMDLNTYSDAINTLITFAMGMGSSVPVEEIAVMSTAATGLRVIFWVGVIIMVIVGVGALLMALGKGSGLSCFGFVLSALMGIGCVGVVTFAEQQLEQQIVSMSSAEDLQYLMSMMGGSLVKVGIGAWVAIAASVAALVLMIVFRPKQA